MTQQELFGLILISLGHVMFNNGVGAATAWSSEFDDEHERYLTSNGVDPLVIKDMRRLNMAQLLLLMQN